jgi:hypothetical protein
VQPVGDPVEAGHGVVGEEGVGASHQGEVVTEVAERLAEVHGGEEERALHSHYSGEN